MKRSIPTYLLIFLMGVQVISAIPAGIALIVDPSGSSIGFEISLLENSPFPDFLIPGLLLMILLGLFPLLILYGLVKKPSFPWAEKFNPHPGRHWSRTFAWYFGLLLIIWINMELLLLIEFFILHFVYSLLGVAIVFLTGLPGVRRDYAVQ